MQDYNTIIGTIQMRLNQCPTRAVMDRYRIGSGTVSLIMSRYNACGVSVEELRMMAPREVELLFYPPANQQRKEVPLPDFQYYYDRIHSSKSRVNISFCWLDYKEKNPGGYEKSQFYEHYNRFVEENYGGKQVSMAVNRKPGEKMYIDWVGDQPELLTDIETGEIKKVHLFATTLGVSSLIYAEAFPNEKLPCFIEGCAHAVSFYGAVAEYFVPDNLKTAVTKHYEKSQFYEHYNRFVEENYGGKQVSMAVNRKPGEKMYIDWVGDQPELLTDIETGEIKKVHLFATTLGVSSLIYAEAFPNEKLPCFIEGCAHAVSFYGAVAEYFVPDNLKTAVTKHTKDELVLQSTFADLEDFYGTIVLPPPARKPKGKPTVENHVKYLETHLIEKLRDRIYTSFEDLNAEIKKIVAVLNHRRFQNKSFSRQDAFEKYDKPCMKPLPGGCYTTCDYKAVLKGKRQTIRLSF